MTPRFCLNSIRRYALFSAIFFALFFFPLHGFSASAEMKFGSIRVEITSDAHASKVVIRGVQSEGANVFTLFEPARIVIDVPGTPEKVGGTKTLSGDAFFKSLRVASHPDKVRFVLDLNGSEIPEYKIDTVNGILTLSIGTIGLAKEAASEKASTPVPTKAAEISPTPKEEKASPKPTEPPVTTPSTASVAPTAAPSPTIAPATLTPAATASESDELSLTGLSFDYAEPDHAPAVLISLNKKSEYRLVKEGDKSYKITLPDCKLASEPLLLPQFPPNDFNGFTMIQASKAGGNLEITIGTDPNIRLAAVPRDNTILVKTSNR